MINNNKNYKWDSKNNEKNIYLYKRKFENWNLKLNIEITMLVSQLF